MSIEVKSFKRHSKKLNTSGISGYVRESVSKKIIKKISPATLKKISFGGQISTLHEIPAARKILMIKNGVSKNELIEIKEESDLDYDTLSNILSVSRATLINKKSVEKFDQATSERIMLLADIVAYGQSVFENKITFNKWMKKINTALGSKTPLELMDTIYGIQEVKKEIGRIEYGIF